MGIPRTGKMEESSKNRHQENVLLREHAPTSVCTRLLVIVVLMTVPVLRTIFTSKNPIWGPYVYVLKTHIQSPPGPQS